MILILPFESNSRSYKEVFICLFNSLIKRIHSPFQKSGGTRLLVDPLWSHGVSKKTMHPTR